ncbi:MAG: ParB N-terminal domain-containing protein [Caulobacter sp.]|nr:ParB N-terminal domain-containing protein [Caulobacter sp.]
MTIDTDITPASAVTSGSVIDVPLNRLKKSPNNARKTPHGDAAIEALAASIAAKGMLQMPVVEPECDPAGAFTGNYLVTIGEGRRLAQLLRIKRKEIKKTELIRVRVDTTNDPHEISLDENVTRTGMHPADQFEAFRDLAERQGYGAEEIAARFGVSASVVRQRLRLGAVSPALMAIYRAGGLTLDQLMAFAVCEDHARQEQVYEALAWNKSASMIRQAMTERHVRASDRRARFVGAEAYAEAGGTILRDLFTEDGGGWFEDVALLDRLTAEKLEGLADDLQTSEGWAWVEAAVDYPHASALRRVYPHPVERSEEDTETIGAIRDESDALIEGLVDDEEVPPEIEARLAEIEAALAAFGEDFVFTPEDIASGGVFLFLGQDGQVRTERGFIRSRDEATEPVEDGDNDEDAVQTKDGDAAGSPSNDQDQEEDNVLAPLSERLIADLTAHRTAGLADRLAQEPDVALCAVIHALVLRCFYSGEAAATCLEVRTVLTFLPAHAPGIEDSLAGRAIAERHETWARQMPGEIGEVWAFVVGLDHDSRLSLLAHCASLSVNAVQTWERRPRVQAHADALAQAVSLDMTTYWSATAASYLGRVTKAKIAEAVGEGVSPEAAERIKPLKKGEMADQAEQLLAGTGWLPVLLRKPQEAEAGERASSQ